MSTSLGNCSQIGNIHRSAKARLVRGIKDGIQRNMLENLVDSQLVRIEHHLDLCSIESIERLINNYSEEDAVSSNDS